MKAIRFRVTGRVQGVFFRKSTQQRATILGVTGWVRNMTDGSVTGHAEGDEATVDALARWLEHGPDRAQVGQIEVEPAGIQGHSAFAIKR